MAGEEGREVDQEATGERKGAVARKINKSEGELVKPAVPSPK